MYNAPVVIGPAITTRHKLRGYTKLGSARVVPRGGGTCKNEMLAVRGGVGVTGCVGRYESGTTAWG